MTGGATDRLRSPTEADLPLRRAHSAAGLEVSLLPNGALFAIEHEAGGRRIMISQMLGSAVGGGLSRVCLRLGDPDPAVFVIAGSGSRGQAGCDGDRIVWQGETRNIRHRTTLWLHPDRNLWLWRIDIVNGEQTPIRCDAVLMQDIGLGDRGFLMNNEAFVSQYLDHQVEALPETGPVIMTRQNLAQSGAHPWVAHGCLDGAAGFATDFRQFLGPRHRDRAGFDLPFGTGLPSQRLQGECAGAALQSHPGEIAPGAAACWTFFGCYLVDHPAASGEADLPLIEELRTASRDFAPRDIALAPIVASLVETAPPLAVLPMTETDIAALYPDRSHVERDDDDGRILSFFVPDGAQNRHVVARDKERLVLRRHGTILLSGRDWLPTDDNLCLTCWMHGVFGAQLTIGNTSLHKLFSVSRDPYNIVRSNGLRMLVDAGDGWRHIATPSLFEMGLQECRWIYRMEDRTITVSMAVAGEPAAQLQVEVDGPACRFLVFGHLVLGERDLAQAGRVEIDATRKRASFRPAEGQVWDQHYPQAVFHLVTGTPESVDAIGCEDLLFADRADRRGEVIALRTEVTTAFRVALVGALNSAEAAAALAERYSRGMYDVALRAQTAPFWRAATPALQLDGPRDDTVDAMNTLLPWLIHNARVHVAVPHGLEQYTGAAWGTRDVCQGPVELLLSLQQDAPVKAILRILFGQQDEERGDWPQWFMLEPYAFIRDSDAHGDVIVWPLKALCDYLEETGDLAFLDAPVGWRHERGQQASPRTSSVAEHVARLLATVESRFLPGTHLIRYGNGDWNDSLQPVDPARRDWMVSSWTVALLYQQLCRYARLLDRAGRAGPAQDHDALAARIRDDFQKYLVRDGTIAGYTLFDPAGAPPDLLLHPADTTTGVLCSLISITQAVIAGLFTPEQTDHHLRLLPDHLSFPDGVRLMDRPIPYHGGVESLFRRAESAAYFGREIGLMYVHAHLRHAEMLAVLGDGAGLWDALAIVNPISVTERIGNAALRQRNAYFSSSDAAFSDRHQASAEWSRVRDGSIPVEAGWRIYSSGPGLYINMLIRHALGIRRSFGQPIARPCLPPALSGLRLHWNRASD